MAATRPVECAKTDGLHQQREPSLPRWWLNSVEPHRSPRGHLSLPLSRPTVPQNVVPRCAPPNRQASSSRFLVAPTKLLTPARQALRLRRDQPPAAAKGILLPVSGLDQPPPRALLDATDPPMERSPSGQNACLLSRVQVPYWSRHRISP